MLSDSLMAISASGLAGKIGTGGFLPDELFLRAERYLPIIQGDFAGAKRHGTLDLIYSSPNRINILSPQRIRFNKRPPWLNLIAH